VREKDLVMFVTARNKVKRKFLKQNKVNFFFFSLQSEKFEAKNSKQNEAKTSEKIGP
jgi:hypothetical protein